MLLTQCPECETAFRLTLDDLAKAGGQVQCGHCRNIFNAIEHSTQEHEQADGKLPGEDAAVLNTDPGAAAGLTDIGVEAPQQFNVESAAGENLPAEIARRLAALFNLQRARLLT
ncbi:MAG: zinc-ribbon domain-containing protein, partial [Pseudomonadota bacterium]|nr:zinc-ribbon domain-containing protein [Pseudomonadota bacterium]